MGERMTLATCVRKLAYIGFVRLKPSCVAGEGALTVLALKSPVQAGQAKI